MTYSISTYNGDEIYNVRCTGDAVCGDEVRFERAIFTGSYRNSVFAGFELITGKIIRDSYGKDKQQHTFTLSLSDGSKMLIKGRNLYANGTFRKPWEDESLRKVAADEKHSRGNQARSDKMYRQLQVGY